MRWESDEITKSLSRAVVSEGNSRVRADSFASGSRIKKIPADERGRGRAAEAARAGIGGAVHEVTSHDSWASWPEGTVKCQNLIVTTTRPRCPTAPPHPGYIARRPGRSGRRGSPTIPPLSRAGPRLKSAASSPRLSPPPSRNTLPGRNYGSPAKYRNDLTEKLS